MPSLNIEEVVRGAIDGDKEAFGILYEEYFTPIYRFIYFRVKNRTDAEDISQNVFIKAYSSIGNYKEHGVPFLAWLYTIARNTTIDYWKKKRDYLLENPDTIAERVVDLNNNIERENER